AIRHRRPRAREAWEPVVLWLPCRQQGPPDPRGRCFRRLLHRAPPASVVRKCRTAPSGWIMPAIMEVSGLLSQATSTRCPSRHIKGSLTASTNLSANELAPPDTPAPSQLCQPAA